MGQRVRESDSDATATTTAAAPTNDYNTVFVDTSLDTHLAMIVSGSDTVSDLKYKIMLEHPLCFPKIGEIKIHALKVKRKEHFYHLSDSMLVRKAFEGAKRNWFISVDASSSKEHGENQNHCVPDSCNHLALVCLANSSSADGPDSLPANPSKMFSGTPKPINQRVPKANQLSERGSSAEVSKDVEMEVNHIQDDRCKDLSFDSSRGLCPGMQESYGVNSSKERSLETGSPAKKKRKIKKQNEDVKHGHVLTDGTASGFTPRNGSSPSVVVDPENFIVNADKDISYEAHKTTSVHKNDNAKDGIVNVLSNNSKKQSLEIGSPGKKKRKIKRQNEDIKVDHVLTDGAASISPSRNGSSPSVAVDPENFIFSAGKDITHDIKIGNKAVSEEHCKTFSLDACNVSKSVSDKKSTLHEGSTEVPTVNVEWKNDMLGGNVQVDYTSTQALQSGPATKKKHVIESKDDSRDPSDEKKCLISNSDNEMSVPKTVVHENNTEDKQKNAFAVLDALTEAQEDNHLKAESVSNKRKKKVKTNSSIPHEKHDDPMQLVVERSDAHYSLVGTGTCKPDDSNINGQSNIPEQAVEFGVKETMFDTLHDLNEDPGQFAPKKIGPDDHKFEIDQTEKIGEEMESSLNNDHEVIHSERCKTLSHDEPDGSLKGQMHSDNLLDAAAETISGRSSGKRKKKTVMKSAAGNQDVSGMECSGNAKSGISAPVANSAINDNLSNEVEKDKSMLSHAGTNQPDNIEERGATMLHEKCNPSDGGEADLNIEVPLLTTKLSDVKGVAESAKSGGSKRQKSRARKPVARDHEAFGMEDSGIEVNGISDSRNQDVSGIECAGIAKSGISASVANSAINDHLSDEIEKDESMLSHTGTNRPDNIEERGATMSHEKCNPSDGGEADLNIEEPLLTTKLSDVKGVAESARSGGSKRQKSRAKKPVAGVHEALDMEHPSIELNAISDARNQDVSGIKFAGNAKSGISAPVANSAINDNLGNEIEKDESMLSPTGTNRPDNIEERGATMLHEMCNPSDGGEADLNIEEPLLTTKLSDVKRVAESAKSGDSKKRKSRAKKSVARDHEALGLEHPGIEVNGLSSELPESDHLTNGTEKNSDIAVHTRRKELPEQKTFTYSIRTDGGADKLNLNETKFLPLAQMNKTEENADDVGEKSIKKVKKDRSSAMKCLPDQPTIEKCNEMEHSPVNQTETIQENAEVVNKKLKRTKKNKNSAVESHSDLPITEPEVGVQELRASHSKMKEVDTPSNATKKNRLAKKSHAAHRAESELELGRGDGIGCNSQPEQIFMNVDSSQVPHSQNSKDNNEWGHETKVDNDCLVEVSKSEGDGIDFKHYFVAGEHQNDGSPADKMKEVKDNKTKKNVKKYVKSSKGTSPDLQDSMKSYEIRDADKKSHNRNSSSIQLQHLSLDKHNEDKSHSSRKSAKVSGNGVKALHSHETDQIRDQKEARQLHVETASGTSRPSPAYPKGKSASVAASSSSSDRSLQNKKYKKRQSVLDHNYVAFRKTSGKSAGEVMNSSRPEKNLLTTPGAIFKDDVSESSADENRSVNSDASTGSPSNTSSSSGYSERDSGSSLDSSNHGSRGANTKEDGGKNIMKSRSGPQNMSMDMILRSSSRFKKAKLTASQTQLEDTESQPVDIVPDSQADR